MLVCSLYAVAVQSKTHKVPLFHNLFCLQGSSQLPLKHLYLLCSHYLTHKTLNYSSNSITINLHLLFWKTLMQSCSGHPRNFKLISKFSYVWPVFPDYLSISYDYGSTLYYMASRSHVSEMQKHGSPNLLTRWPRMSLKLWGHRGKSKFVWFSVYGFWRSASLC